MPCRLKLTNVTIQLYFCVSSAETHTHCMHSHRLIQFSYNFITSTAIKADFISTHSHLHRKVEIHIRRNTNGAWIFRLPSFTIVEIIIKYILLLGTFCEFPSFHLTCCFTSNGTGGFNSMWICAGAASKCQQLKENNLLLVGKLSFQCLFIFSFFCVCMKYESRSIYEWISRTQCLSIFQWV